VFIAIMKSRFLSISLFISLSITLGAQDSLDTLSFFEPSPVFHQSRFYKALAFSTTTYTAFSIGLYNAWYKKFDQEAFHFFDDWNEWQNIDKYGHVYTSYFQGVLCYKGAKWTGLSENQSILTGIVCGTLFQSTIEVMDGFSSKWGFSLSDFAANNVGLATFALQQKYWHEQRISLKVSSAPIQYSKESIPSSDGLAFSSLDNRVDDLFGSNYFERALKDYNAQTLWLSVNVDAFLPKGNSWPDWLNLAVGYSGESMFGGFENVWTEENAEFVLGLENDRYKQFMLGFDFDLTRIDVDNHFLKSLFSIFNIFKYPAPAIEYNTRGEWRFHLLFLN